mmetsp:Transcript_5132/g.14668  ORF Transcript_5132/g.14668 Transcript_5132/m.14668 type:complete len:226 (-) Transcript_5132:3-680(-)
MANTDTAGPMVKAKPSKPPMTPRTAGRLAGAVASMTIAWVMGMLPPERPATVRTTNISTKVLTPAVTKKHAAVQTKQPSNAGRLPTASETRPTAGAPSSCAKLKEAIITPTYVAVSPKWVMQKYWKTGTVIAAPHISKKTTRNKPYNCFGTDASCTGARAPPASASGMALAPARAQDSLCARQMGRSAACDRGVAASRPPRRALHWPADGGGRVEGRGRAPPGMA